MLGQLLPLKVLLDQYKWEKGLPLLFSFSFTSVSRSARGFASKSKFTKIRKKKTPHTMKLYPLCGLAMSAELLHVDQG